MGVRRASDSDFDVECYAPPSVKVARAIRGIRISLDVLENSLREAPDANVGQCRRPEALTILLRGLDDELAELKRLAPEVHAAAVAARGVTGL